MNSLQNAITEIDEQIEKLKLIKKQLHSQMLELSLIEDSDITEVPTEIDDIVKLVSEHFQLSTTTLLFGGRAERIVWPRQVAMALCREFTEFTYQELGSYFKKDHGTIIHACKSVECRCETSVKQLININYLREKIEAAIKPECAQETMELNYDLDTSQR